MVSNSSVLPREKKGGPNFRKKNPLGDHEPEGEKREEPDHLHREEEGGEAKFPGRVPVYRAKRGKKNDPNPIYGEKKSNQEGHGVFEYDREGEGELGKREKRPRVPPSPSEKRGKRKKKRGGKKKGRITIYSDSKREKKERSF